MPVTGNCCMEQIMGLIAAGVVANVTDRPGGIFVRPANQISKEDRILLQTVARAIITDIRGTLAEQINRRGFVAVPVPPRHRQALTMGRPGWLPDDRAIGVTTPEYVAGGGAVRRVIVAYTRARFPKESRQ